MPPKTITISESSWFLFDVLNHVMLYLVQLDDKKVAIGHGQQVVKVVLLAAPVFVGPLIIKDAKKRLLSLIDAGIKMVLRFC